MTTILIGILMITINILSTFLGWLLTEYEPTRISRLPFLNFKPFTCKPCLTFWIISLLQVIIAIILHSYTYGILGVIFAFGTFAALKLDEKNNVQ